MRVIFRRAWIVAALLLLQSVFFGGSAAAQSISVEPLFVEVAPGQSAAIRVRNGSESRQTIEVSVAERQVSESGQVTRLDAEDGFVVLPPQAVIEPNSVQVIRVQSIEPDLARSHSYYVTVRQLPVAMSAEESNGARLQVVFAFDIAMHVVPRGANGEPVVISATPAATTVPAPGTEEQASAVDRETRESAPRISVPGVEVTVRNDGSKYLYLHELVYDVTGIAASDGQRVDLASPSERDILEAVGVPLLSPGATRRFILPFREAPPLSGAEVNVRPKADA